METQRIKSELLSKLPEIENEFIDILSKNSFFFESPISINYFKEKYSKQFLLHYINNLHIVSSDIPLFLVDFIKDNLLFEEVKIKTHTLLIPFVVFKDIVLKTVYELNDIDPKKTIEFLIKEEIEYFKQVIEKYNFLINYEENLFHTYKDLLNLNVIVSKSDLQGTIKYANQAFCEVSGYSKSELIGENHNILRHPEVSSYVFENLWETISSGKIWKGILKNKAKSGESYWVQGIIVPIIINDKISEYVSLRVDITNNILNRDLNNFLLRQYDYFIMTDKEEVVEFNGNKDIFIDCNFNPINNHINDLIYNFGINKEEFSNSNKIKIAGVLYKVLRYKYDQSKTVIFFNAVN